jgi:hypothetical protein
VTPSRDDRLWTERVVRDGYDFAHGRKVKPRTTANDLERASSWIAYMAATKAAWTVTSVPESSAPFIPSRTRSIPWRRIALVAVAVTAAVCALVAGLVPALAGIAVLVTAPAYRRLAARPTRHQRTLANIDRLERELGIVS